MTTPDSVRRQSPVLPDHDLYLDWLRGLAALLVFWTHVRGSYFVKWSDLDPASQTHLNYLLFFTTRLGREAVIIFFVLSGCLVGGHALSAYRKGSYSLRDYLIARISRLYVVVVPALLLTAGLDYLSGAWSSHDHSLYLFLVNMFFLQGLFGDAYGSNGPLWSLAYEWWFYVLWGFGLATLTRQSAQRRAVSLLVVVAATVLLAWKCPPILLMFPLWLLGVVARSLPPSRWSPRVTILLSFIGLCIALAISATRWDWVGDLLVGSATATLLYFCKGLKAPSVRWFSFGKPLAAFSFSLYVVHYPLNGFMGSVFAPQRLSNAGVLNWLGWLLLVVAEALLCWCFYWLFERRTPAVRAALSRLPAHFQQRRVSDPSAARVET